MMPIEAVLALKEGDLLRLNAPAAGRHHAVRRPGAGAHRPPGPQRQPPRRAGHRAASEACDERRRRTAAARPVHRARPASACSRCSPPGKVSIGEVTSLSDAKAAFAGVPVPAVAMSVSYVDGVTGGNVFLITLDGARNARGVDDGHGRARGPGRDRALRARAVRRLGGDEPDDGLGRGRDVGRARHRGGDLHARDQDVHVRRRDRRRLPGDAARRADRDVDLRRARAARPARAERVRRAHVERARRHRRRGLRRPAAGQPRRAAGSTAGQALAGRHPGARVGRARPRADALRAGRRPARRAPSSSSTSRPTTRSICTSTERTSPRAAWSSWTEPTGPCASSTCSTRPSDSDSGMEVAGWPESW